MAEITDATAVDIDEFWQDAPQDVTGATETSEDQDRAGGQVMDKQIIERAVEAAARAMYERGESENLLWGALDLDERTYRALALVGVKSALAEVESSLTAERDDLAASVARVEALHVWCLTCGADMEAHEGKVLCQQYEVTQWVCASCNGSVTS